MSTTKYFLIRGHSRSQPYAKNVVTTNRNVWFFQTVENEVENAK